MASLAISKILSKLPKTMYNNTLWIAYSGGVDSTVLLHAAAKLFKNFGFPLRAIHVHHGLSQYADQWAAHCQGITQSLNIPLIIKRLPDKPQKGDSIEAWARAARRAAFAEVMQEGDVLVTAQHADDQAETLLLQMLRGAGVEGMAAMPAWSTLGIGHQWRPFLTLSKAQLQQYAQQHQLPWIEDDSNQDQRFERNFLRQQVMPLLAKRWPAVVPTLGRVAENCADAQELIDFWGDEQVGYLTDRLNRITDYLPIAQRHMLRAWIRRQTGHILSRAQLLEAIDSVVNAAIDANPVMRLGEYDLRRYQRCLYLVKREILPDIFEQPWNGQQPLMVPGQPKPLTKVLLQEQGLAVDALDWSQVVVRFRYGNTRCKPRGRQHSQTLKKLLLEYGIPPWQRQHLPLIFCNDQLVMVVGVFVCGVQ